MDRLFNKTLHSIENVILNESSLIAASCGSTGAGISFAIDSVDMLISVTADDDSIMVDASDDDSVTADDDSVTADDVSIMVDASDDNSVTADDDSVTDIDASDSDVVNTFVVDVEDDDSDTADDVSIMVAASDISVIVDAFGASADVFLS